MKTIFLLLLLSTLAHSANERAIQNKHCEGITEWQLTDKTRVDCITYTTAYEYDFDNKWAEAIGQALHYGLMTQRQAGIRIICKTKRCNQNIRKIEAIKLKYNLKIKVEKLQITDFD